MQSCLTVSVFRGFPTYVKSAGGDLFLIELDFNLYTIMYHLNNVTVFIFLRTFLQIVFSQYGNTVLRSSMNLKRIK